MVCTPSVGDQLALFKPSSVISRSSDRGYPEPLVVTPLTGARNWTPLQAEFTLNQGSTENVARAGCLISVGFSEAPVGSVSFQLVRFSCSEGKSQGGAA